MDVVIYLSHWLHKYIICSILGHSVVNGCKVLILLGCVVNGFGTKQFLFMSPVGVKI